MRFKELLFITIVILLGLRATAQDKTEVIEKFRNSSSFQSYFGEPFHLNADIISKDNNIRFDLIYADLNRIKLKVELTGPRTYCYEIVVDNGSGWFVDNEQSVTLLSREDIQEMASMLYNWLGTYDPQEAGSYELLTKLFDRTSFLESTKSENVLRMELSDSVTTVDYVFDTKTGLLSSIRAKDIQSAENNGYCANINYLNLSKALESIQVFRIEQGIQNQTPELTAKFENIKLIGGVPFALNIKVLFENDKDKDYSIRVNRFEPSFEIDPKIFEAPNLPEMCSENDEDVQDFPIADAEPAVQE